MGRSEQADGVEHVSRHNFQGHALYSQPLETLINLSDLDMIEMSTTTLYMGGGSCWHSGDNMNFDSIGGTRHLA